MNRIITISLLLLTSLLSIPVYSYDYIPFWGGWNINQTANCGASGIATVASKNFRSMLTACNDFISQINTSTTYTNCNPPKVATYFSNDYKNCTYKTTQGTSTSSNTVTQYPTCPYGGTLTSSNGGMCVNSPNQPPPECPQPQNHPCDYTASEYQSFCKSILTWDTTSCEWQSSNCGWEEMNGFNGYYPNVSASIGEQGCMWGCLGKVDEVTNGIPHLTFSGGACASPISNPLEPEAPIDYCDGTVNAEWCPDPNPSTNCGEYNGEYVCLDSIPDNTCQTTTSGNVFCVGYPTPPTPNTVKPVDPQPGPDYSTTINNNSNQTTNTNIYNNTTIINYGNGFPNCPSGTTYQNGVCVKPPDDPNNPTCPPGFELKNGVCEYTALGQGGPFNGPSINIPANFANIPDYSYFEPLNELFTAIQSAPILDFSPSCSPGTASCPAFSVMGISTSIHCDLAEYAIPLIQAFLWLVAGLAAVRAVLSA